jgi:heat shock protein HslJ
MVPVFRAISGVLAVTALVACSASPAPRAAALPPVTPIMIPPPMTAADAAALGGPAWQWQAPQSGTPADHYTLQFMDDGRVVVRADCNRGGGRYTADANGTLTLTPIALTKMGCPAGSLDTAFVRDLREVTGYRFEAETLRLALRSGGSMTFRR